MAVKTKPLDSEISRLIRQASQNDGSGGTTDGLEKGTRYLAEIVDITPDCEGQHFNFISTRYGDKEVQCYVYKIKLLQELGASSKGYEVLYSNGADDLKDDAWEPSLDPPATTIKKRLTELGVTEKQFSNLQKNLLPEGVYVENTAFELPAISDKVYATGDGGIEGRYQIEPLPGAQKARGGGYSPINARFKPGTSSPEIMKDKAGKVIKPKYDPHGDMILDSNNPKRKETILNFVKENMITDAPPILAVSSDYGKRGSYMHSGIDIAVAARSNDLKNNDYALQGKDKWVKVYAPSDGMIFRAAFQDEFGNGAPWNNGNHILFHHSDSQDFAPGQASFFLHFIGLNPEIRPFINGQTPGAITSQDGTNPVPSVQVAQSQARKTLQNRIGEERQYTSFSGNSPTGWKTRGNKRDFPLGVGVTVKKGYFLGYIGNSGKSSGVHLHWQFQNKVDPYRYILIYNGKKNQQGNS